MTVSVRFRRPPVLTPYTAFPATAWLPSGSALKGPRFLPAGRSLQPGALGLTSPGGRAETTASAAMRQRQRPTAASRRTVTAAAAPRSPISCRCLRHGHNGPEDARTVITRCVNEPRRPRVVAECERVSRRAGRDCDPGNDPECDLAAVCWPVDGDLLCCSRGCCVSRRSSPSRSESPLSGSPDLCLGHLAGRSRCVRVLEWFRWSGTPVVILFGWELGAGRTPDYWCLVCYP